MRATLGPVRGLESRGLTAYCVWRNANSDAVASFIDGLAAGTVVHLHCLDEMPIGRTAQLTRSSGPGLRMPLLNRLIETHPPAPGSDVLLFDDDVSFVGGGARLFGPVARTAGLDLAQPAHSPMSHSTFRVNQMRLLSIARDTGFVESGPVVLMSQAAWERLLPFPADIGMGWGLDVEWTKSCEAGLRIGVVDATPVRHLGPVATEYGVDSEWEILQSRLRMVGASSIQQFAEIRGACWRPWQRIPPWSRSPSP